MLVQQIEVPTPFGTWFLAASQKGIVHFQNKPFKRIDLLSNQRPYFKILDEAKRELALYFSGQLKTLSSPVDLTGSEFQIKIWQQLTRIPFGKTASYKEIATHVQSPKAYRAVGNTNSKNPVWIFIPCHRVIQSSGNLGGYAAGVKIKQALLNLESKNTGRISHF